ncbi:hypothetical protein Rs2_05008 [Raphanus sativus]|nr:hypothetical protein Rs2_05008 [Raphanus sativus]
MECTDTCMEVHETLQERSFQYPASTLETSCRELRYMNTLSSAYQSIAKSSFNLNHQISDPYSREEIDEKLNEIYTIQEDSMNDFKCKLDGVYHPLNTRITWLTKTMEYLAGDVITILKRETRKSPAWKP